MKVGVYLDDYVPQDGGAYTFQADVFLALRRLAVESRHQFVVIASPDKEIEKSIRGTNLQWLSNPPSGLLERAYTFITLGFPSLRTRWRWQSSFERRARRARVEFVWFLTPRAKVIDIPYMAIVLDLQHRLQPWFPEVSALGQWETRERHYATFLRRATAIITGTQAGKEEITRFYQIPEERIHILPHPAPSQVFTGGETEDQTVLARLGLQPGYLFYPAQFWAHKNHVNLLIALKQLRQDGLRIPLALAGADFGNRGFVEAKIRELGLDDQVHLLGFVAQAEMPALYRGALALAYVSLFGPENMPPLEAFALGCPVMAADVSGAAEQLGDAALLVNPADPKGIAVAIRKLLDDEVLRTQLVSRGHERAARWTVEDFVRGVFGILDSFEPIRHLWG